MIGLELDKKGRDDLEGMKGGILGKGCFIPRDTFGPSQRRKQTVGGKVQVAPPGTAISHGAR